MAFITYPLNNIDYTAEDAELFHCTRTSGIWAEDSFPISVTGTDNNVTIGKGIAWINNEEFSGKVTALKSAEVLDLGIADSTYPRIDVIAIQFNANNNATDIVVKKGIPATNPVRPAIIRNGAVYELYIASVYRPTGATAITASNITDLRMDETVCGLMADSVTRIDTSAINAQVEALIANLGAEIETVKDTSGLMFESEWVENGVIPVSKSGTGAVTAEEALANLGGISIVKLWENASPTSSFPAQTLDNELADAPINYDEVEITMITYDLNGTCSGTCYRVKRGETARLLIYGKHLHYRDVTVTDTSIIFGVPYICWNMDNKFESNDVVNAPLRIKGIKGVQ